LEFIAGGGQLQGNVQFGEEGRGGEDFDADEARQEAGNEVIPLFDSPVEMVDGREEEDAGAAGGIEQMDFGLRISDCGLRILSPYEIGSIKPNSGVDQFQPSA